jgi:predicted dehydrogenase
VFEDWQDLVSSPDIDAVVLGTWPHLHVPIGLAAMECGKHFLCEAAIAPDLEGARALYAASQQRPQLKTLLSSMARLSRADAMVRKLLADGFVGQVQQVLDYRLDGAYADAAKPLHWRQSRQYSGVNFQFLGERANIIRRWLGEHRRVLAQTRTYYPERPAAAAQGQLPDTMNVLAELEDGTPVSYIHSGVARFGGPPRVEIYGSEGTLVHYLDAGPGAAPEEVRGARAGEDALRPISIPDDLASKGAVDVEFIAMIREGRPPAPDLSTFYDGVKYVEFLTACFLSAEREAWVDLPLP